MRHRGCLLCCAPRTPCSGSFTALSWFCCPKHSSAIAISFPRYPPLCSAIYKYALDHLPKSQAGELYRRFVQFEKQLGDREGIEVRGPAFKRWS